jgi:hypothetical protein
MSKGILAALLGVCCLCALDTAQAFDDFGYYPGTTRMVADAGIAAGGDKLETVVFNNGDTRDIYAGDGLLADFGVQHNFAYSNWSLKATVGFDYRGVNASNANISFTRYPLDLIALYNVGSQHFGFGLTEHLSPELDNDGLAPNVNFNSAAGVILQYQYSMITVRATGIHYTVSGNCPGNCSVNGGNLGVFFTVVF